MRVLAHCTNPAEPFSQVRRRVLADAIATHGDPVAVVGAQMYAFALWASMRRRDEPIRWGQLIEETLEQTADWAVFDADAVPSDWASHAPDSYAETWMRVVDATVQLLTEARSAMAEGALAVDEQVLDGLGCFSDTGGAGTITAAAALYLASRHASNPGQGLLRAAFARGADTDTLAAMTGALLGAVHGPGWLGAAASEVMDSELLARVLVESGSAMPSSPPERYHPSARRQVEQQLASVLPGFVGQLPFYGRVEIIHVRDLDNRLSRIRSWWFRNETGQTFRIKAISKAKRNPWVPLTMDGVRTAPPPSSPSASERVRSGFVVRVVDIERARAFYELVIGLPVSRETRSSIVLGGWLALEKTIDLAAQTSILDPGATRFAVTVYARGDQFAAVERRLTDSNVAFERADRDSGQTLKTADPDGTPVEIRLAP